MASRRWCYFQGTHDARSDLFVTDAPDRIKQVKRDFTAGHTIRLDGVPFSVPVSTSGGCFAKCRETEWIGSASGLMRDLLGTIRLHLLASTYYPM